MKTEQLPPSQASAKGPAQLPGGGQFELGATHAENAGLPSTFGPHPSALDSAEPRDLTPEQVAAMFGPAETPQRRLEQQGVQFVNSPTEMGGGENEWFIKARDHYRNRYPQDEAGLNALRGRIQELDQAVALGQVPAWVTGGWQQHIDDLRSALDSVRKEHYAAIANRQLQALPDIPQSVEMLRKTKDKLTDAIAMHLIGGASWPQEWSKILPDESLEYVAAIDTEIARRTRVVINPEEMTRREVDPLGSFSEAARNHVLGLMEKYREDKRRSRGDEAADAFSFVDLINAIKEEYAASNFVGRNPPVWLFPPHLKPELLRAFGLSPMISTRRTGGTNGG